jgi:signal peptidase II
MTRKPSNARVFWGAVVIVVVLDVLTKILVQQKLSLLEPRQIIGDIVRFTLVYNPGAAFSMSLGSKSRWIFGSFAVIALYILWRLYRQSAAGDWLRSLALGLAWGGAAGNLMDRIRSGRGVVDFIDVGVGTVRFWTFNIADSAVTVGAVLLAWVLWHEDRTPERVRRASDSQPSGSERGEERTGA